MAQMIRPERLTSGDRIGIVSPSYWLEDARLSRAVEVFTSMGYEVICGESTRLKQDVCAGSPEERAADIMTMFADPSIRAILCARGGYGSNRVVPLLDYELIRHNPKIFLGYSDVTGLLASIAKKSSLVTFHGPMLSSFATRTLQYNLDTLAAVLSGEDDVTIKPPPGFGTRCLVPGQASGPLYGGNLTLLIERLGTPDQIDPGGGILFLEDIDEKLYAFDRMMLHLKRSGTLDGIRGLVIGEMIEMGDSQVPFGKDVDEIVLDVCADLEIPIISQFPCGHGDYQATLPIAHEVEMEASADDSLIRIPKSPVC